MSTPNLETIAVEVDGDCAVATLNRPKKLNAVSATLLADLVRLAEWLREQPDIHFLVLDHAGRVFSAGADLDDARATATDPNARALLRANQRLAQDMMAKMSNIEQISFAAMRGSAYGAGAAIALTCDFRVMAENAVINLPETKLGMFLTYGSTPFLVQSVGVAAAKEMILYAEDWTAQQCLAAGAAQAVVPADQVRAKIDERIAVLRERDWEAVRISKQVVNASAPPQFGNMILSEPELVAHSLAGGNMADEVGEFLNRKKK